MKELKWFLIRSDGGVALVVFNPHGSACYSSMVDNRKHARQALEQIRCQNERSYRMLEQSAQIIDETA